jgi:His/Glu/Gln/Arg/opine family amino acid ABC transporter permease subunit
MTVWHMLAGLLVGYPQPPDMLDPRFPVFVQCASGLLLTILVTLGSLIGGAVIGLTLALCRRDGAEASPARPRPARIVVLGAGAVVEGIRALPIAVLVLVMFHMPYSMIGARLPEGLLAIVAFSIYAGVYLCEIIRSGLRSVPDEMWQAARVLGLPPHRIFLRIELPIVCRNMTPDLINLVITLFKDSSALAVVAVSELTYIGRQMVMSQPGSYGLVMLLVLAMYWVPASILSAVALRAESRRVGQKDAAWWLAMGAT